MTLEHFSRLATTSGGRLGPGGGAWELAHAPLAEEVLLCVRGRDLGGASGDKRLLPLLRALCTAASGTLRTLRAAEIEFEGDPAPTLKCLTLLRALRHLELGVGAAARQAGHPAAHTTTHCPAPSRCPPVAGDH